MTVPLELLPDPWDIPAVPCRFILITLTAARRFHMRGAHH